MNRIQVLFGDPEISEALAGPSRRSAICVAVIVAIVVCGGVAWSAEIVHLRSASRSSRPPPAVGDKGSRLPVSYLDLARPKGMIGPIEVTRDPGWRLLQATALFLRVIANAAPEHYRLGWNGINYERKITDEPLTARTYLGRLEERSAGYRATVARKGEQGQEFVLRGTATVTAKRAHRQSHEVKELLCSLTHPQDSGAAAHAGRWASYHGTLTGDLLRSMQDWLGGADGLGYLAARYFS